MARRDLENPKATLLRWQRIKEKAKDTEQRGMEHIADLKIDLYTRIVDGGRVGEHEIAREVLC